MGGGAGVLDQEPRFRILHRVLDPPGADPEEEAPDPGSKRMEAAVALIIRATDPLEMLIVKRATYEGDRWSGHMALPGGRWEPGDAGLLHTARRETREETGVDLHTYGAPLGRLADVTPASPSLPAMRVAPFVFGVPADTSAAVANRELESVHWVPVERLRDPASSTTVRIHFSGFSKTFPSYRVVPDEHVWGLTHRILTGFLDRYPEAELDELSED
jgi:8-oxo-dGTP pyrophosphatase MutT (NUDIX family)